MEGNFGTGIAKLKYSNQISKFIAVLTLALKIKGVPRSWHGQDRVEYFCKGIAKLIWLKCKCKCNVHSMQTDRHHSRSGDRGGGCRGFHLGFEDQRACVRGGTYLKLFIPRQF